MQQILELNKSIVTKMLYSQTTLDYQDRSFSHVTYINLDISSMHWGGGSTVRHGCGALSKTGLRCNIMHNIIVPCTTWTDDFGEFNI